MYDPLASGGWESYVTGKHSVGFS